MEFKIRINGLSATTLAGTGNQTLEIKEEVLAEEGLASWIQEKRPNIGDTLRGYHNSRKNVG